MKSASDFYELARGRRGHFALESGHHGELWLDLDALFADAQRIAPFVSSLANALVLHKVEAVCGPLLGGAFLAQLVAQALSIEWCFTERELPREPRGLYQARYRLPRAFSTRIAGKRVAIVDDVMSAGSALRGTYVELASQGAQPVVAGALLVLGDAGATDFAERGVPVESVTRDDYALWLPGDCPLCRDGHPLEYPNAG